MRHWRDWQSVLYLVLLPCVVVYQWRNGFHWSLYLLELFLVMGVGVIHHNHAHLRMWHNKKLNRFTDLWISILQGHPTFVFYPAHSLNHHRYKHSEKDWARTYQFNWWGASGDTNHLLGYLLHPVQAITVLYPEFVRWLIRQYCHHRAYFYYCCFQYLLVIVFWISLFLINVTLWFWLVLVPQLFGLHWLLVANYLQHAHADRSGKGLNYARNFYGWVNPLLFNIGLHTAHHEHPRAHWSQLTALQQRYRPQLDARLQEPSLLRYMWRCFILGALHPRWRSQPFQTKD